MPKVVLKTPRLQFGPYVPPRVQIGQEIECARQGKVKVRGWSEGEVPWPVSRRSLRRGTAPTMVLCGDLVRVVQRESAVAVAVALA